MVTKTNEIRQPPDSQNQMPIHYRAFEHDDYTAARALWEATDGVGLSSADERPAIERFLDRNPGLSRVAVDGERLVGAILGGHDGRRGVARILVREGLEGLAREGVEKCHPLTFQHNPEGRAFWAAIGAEHRDALAVYSLPT
jgi:putative acetyltransferase